MKKIIALTLFLLSLSIATGCVSRPALKKPKTPNESLIFGHVDMREAPGRFTGAVMKQVQPVAKQPYRTSWVVKHDFFLENGVPPGVYKMDNLRTLGGFQSSVVYVYEFPKTGRGQMDVKVTKPGLYYAGAWKFKKVKVGFVDGMKGKGKFDIVPAKSPSELEVLKRILPFSKDDYWTNMIEKRIRELENKK